MKPRRRNMLFVTAVVTLLFFTREIWPSLFAYAQRPVASAGIFLSERLFLFSHDRSEFAKENENLRTRLSQRVLDTITLERLRDENEQLKAQLNFVQRQKSPFLGAHVLSRRVDPLSVSVVLDRGARDGVFVGAPVIVEDGILIGIIDSVGASYALTRPLTDRSSRVGASLLGRSQTVGLVEGTAGRLFTLNYIPQDETIEINDIVVTSGLDESIPPGLLIGLVNRVEADPEQPFQRASVEPLLDERFYDTVNVLLTSQDL